MYMYIYTMYMYNTYMFLYVYRVYLFLSVCLSVCHEGAVEPQGGADQNELTLRLHAQLEYPPHTTACPCCLFVCLFVCLLSLTEVPRTDLVDREVGGRPSAGAALLPAATAVQVGVATGASATLGPPVSHPSLWMCALLALISC